TGYRGTVHFSSTDSQAILPANYTFTAADNGVHTFSVTFKTAGTCSLTAIDTAADRKSVTKGSLVDTAAAPSSQRMVNAVLRVTGYPSPATMGMAGTFAVTAMDSYGNTASGYRGTVHFSSNDSQAVLPANYTFAAADNGVHSFSAAFKTAGTCSLTAIDTA